MRFFVLLLGWQVQRLATVDLVRAQQAAVGGSLAVIALH
jgi:hypothetical protein